MTSTCVPAALNLRHTWHKSELLIPTQSIIDKVDARPSGVCPATCSIGAAEVVPKAAHNAFRSSWLMWAASSPVIIGILLGDLIPANHPSMGHRASSKSSHRVTWISR